MRLFTAADAARHLPMDAVIDAVDAAFREHARGTLPPPERLDSYLPDGEFHVKAGYAPGVFAVKANSAFFANPPARPAIQGVIVLYDTQTGTPLALTDSGVLTALRTAAASAVAARLLASADASTLGLVGAGLQAWHHVRAMAAVRPVTAVRVWSRNPASAESLAERVRRELGLEAIVVASPSEAARAPVVVTCTPSTAPLLDAGDVAPGTFIAAVGADSPHKQELSSALTAASSVVPDVLAQCLTAGELHHAVDDGLMTAADVTGELGALLERHTAGGGTGPASDGSRPVVFDSTGTGFQDAAAAAALVAASGDQAGIKVELDGG